MLDSMSETTWSWCLRHDRPERSDEHCRADDRLGPYPTEEAARRWKDRVESRNDTWEDEDERWEGKDDD